MPISPEANQMAQLQGQQMMDPQKLMMLLAALQQQGQGQGQGLSATLGGMPAMGGTQPGQGSPPGSPPTLGLGQPIPMQMPNPDPQGQQKQSPLPPDPMGMQ